MLLITDSGIGVEIKPVRIRPEDVVVIRFRTEDATVDQVEHVYRYIKDIFNNNMVIAIPDMVSVDGFSKAELRKILESIEGAIKG